MDRSIGRAISGKPAGMQGYAISSQTLGEGHHASTDLLSPDGARYTKRPSIENTTVLMPHPYAIDQVDALLDY